MAFRPDPKYGPTVNATDLRVFIQTELELPLKTASASAREAFSQLLNRVPQVEFVCLLCQRVMGRVEHPCRCPSQGGESARYPGVWAYHLKKMWAVTRRSLVKLTADDLRVLSPMLRERVLAWVQHLRKTAT